MKKYYIYIKLNIYIASFIKNNYGYNKKITLKNYNNIFTFYSKTLVANISEDITEFFTIFFMI